MRQDQLADAFEMGRRNQEILELAHAWCRNVRRDRGLLGIGIPEQQTGLPISGGALACDYAEPPQTYGMDLGTGAVEFYRRNCIGCRHHRPTGRFPNLGTWAESILAQRRVEAEKAEAEAASRRQAREQRHQERRLIFGHLDAFAREVLELIEKLDAEEPDQRAGGDLVALARLNPGGFTPELIRLLELEATQPGTAPCLAALFELHRVTGRPDRKRILGLAFMGLRIGSAVEAAADLVAELSSSDDVARLKEIFPRLVELAGRGPSRWSATPPKPCPAALFRFLKLDSRAVEQMLADELRRGEDWRRSPAARALQQLIGVDQDVGLRLLPGLLEGLKVPDDDRVDVEMQGSLAIAGTIADVLRDHPVAADELIGRYLEKATDEYKRRVMRAYRRVVRGTGRGSHRITPVVAQVVAKRSLNTVLKASDFDIVSAAGDTLKMVCREHGTQLDLSLDAMVGGLVLLAQDLRDLDNAPPARDPIQVLSRQQMRSRLQMALRMLREAVAELTKARPSFLWDQIEATWDGGDDLLRRQLLLLVAEAARGDYERLPRLLPMVYTAMCHTDHVGRAYALRVLDRVANYRDLDVPEAVSTIVMALLGDKYLVVMREAAKLVSRVPIPEEKRIPIINVLLSVVHVYATDRLESNLVHDAMASALRLASPTEENQVREMLLRAVDRMAAHSAAETLDRFQSLEANATWLPTALRALRVDEDADYSHLGEDDRDYLLQAMSWRGSELEEHLDELIARARERLPGDRMWGWAVADLLSAAGYHAAARSVSIAVYDSIPDTHEQRHARWYALQVVSAYGFESTVAEGDNGAIVHALEQWEELSQIDGEGDN